MGEQGGQRARPSPGIVILARGPHGRSLLTAPHTSSCLTDEGTEIQRWAAVRQGHTAGRGGRGFRGRGWSSGEPQSTLCRCQAARHTPAGVAPSLASSRSPRYRGRAVPLPRSHPQGSRLRCLVLGPSGSGSRSTLWPLPRVCHRSPEGGTGLPRASGALSARATQPGTPSSAPKPPLPPALTPSIKTQTPNDLRNCQPTTRCPGAVLPTAPLSALWLTQGCVITLLLPPAHPSSSLTKPQPSQPPARHRVTVTSTRKPPRMPQGWMRSTSGLPSQLCCHRPAVLQGGCLLPTPAHAGRPLQAWPERSQPLQRGN